MNADKSHLTQLAPVLVFVIAAVSLVVGYSVFPTQSRYDIMGLFGQSILLSMLVASIVLLAIYNQSENAPLSHYSPLTTDGTATISRHITLALGIAAAGIIIRLLLFDVVPVNRDTSLYLYDGLRMAEGATPMVNYHSRSPLFHAFLAGIIWLPIDPLIGARTLTILVSVGVGLATYGVASRIHSRRVALVAMTIHTFSPLVLVWGTWLKTEQYALLLVLVGLYVLLPRIEKEWVTGYTVMGLAFGVAFLVRRTAIVYATAIGLALLYYRVRFTGTRPTREVVRVGAMAAVTLVTILLGYVMITWPSLADASVLLHKHLLSTPPFTLIFSIESPAAGGGKAASTGICFRCFLHLIRTSAMIVLLGFPAIIPAIGYLDEQLTSRTLTSETVQIGEWEHQVEENALPLRFVNAIRIVAGLGIVSLGYLLVRVTDASAIQIAGVGNGIVLLLIVIWLHSRLPDLDKISFAPKDALIAAPGVTLGAVYLIRSTRVHVTYFQELYPFVSIFGALFLVHVFDAIEKEWFRKATVIVLALGGILGLIAAPYLAAPMGGVNHPYSTSVGTVTTIQEVGDVITANTSPDDQIFSAQPIFALTSNRQNAVDFSRELWYYDRNVTERKHAITSRLAPSLASGDVKYVVVEERTRVVFESSPRLQRIFEEKFCAVDTDAPVSLFDGAVYRYDPDCSSTQRSISTNSVARSSVQNP